MGGAGSARRRGLLKWISSNFSGANLPKYRSLLCRMTAQGSQYRGRKTPRLPRCRRPSNSWLTVKRLPLQPALGRRVEVLGRPRQLVPPYPQFILTRQDIYLIYSILKFERRSNTAHRGEVTNCGLVCAVFRG